MNILIISIIVILMKITDSMIKKKFGGKKSEEDAETNAEKKAESLDPKMELAEALALKKKK